MFTFLVILMCVMSVLLILAVLVQPGKGDMAAGFGGMGGQFGAMFGMRRASDFLMKFTIGLALGILLLAIVANKLFLHGAVDERNPVTVGAPAPASLPKSGLVNPPAQQAPAQQNPQPQQGK